MPLQSTSGAASYDGFGGGAAALPTYIEDVFSTWLYTQTSSGANIPLVTGVGSVASSAWQANGILVSTSYPPSCAVDASGNYYQAVGKHDDGCFVAKYSATGATLWLVKIRIDAGATGSTKVIYPVSIKVAASGNIYIAGHRPASACLIKLNSSGVTQWTRELGASINGSNIALALDASENSHVVYTSGALQGQYARFNSSGTQDTGVSKVFYTATQTFARGVDVDSSGNVYVSGEYYDTTYYYAFVIKFNSSMVSQWARVLTRTDAGRNNNFKSVSVDGSGNVYVAGNLRSASSTDVAGIAKYNSAGTLQWQRQIAPASGSISNVSSKTDQGGDTYLVGYGGPGWLISKIDTSGALSWNSAMIAVGAGSNQYPTGVDVDGAGGLFVAGQASQDLVSANVEKPRVLKISADGTSNGITVFGALTSGSYSISNGSWSATTPSFTVSSGSAFSAVTTYLSAADSVATTFDSIPLSTATDAMVWSKSRSASGNNLVARSTSTALITNSTSAESASTKFKALTSNGVLIESDYTTVTNVLWTFREQPKFFDVVTWTGNGIQPRTISHSLGSVPGCVIGKRTSSTSDWVVYHRSLNGGTNPDQYQVLLNTTAAQSGPGSFLLAAAPTSTEISVAGVFNSIGVTYVAYLFAHDAGGFGLSGTDNVISCGSYTGNGATVGTEVTLGYEPQWLLIKRTDSTSNWTLLDTMRGIPTGSDDARLFPNLSNAESSSLNVARVTATGFQLEGVSLNGSGETYIYIAIRRGPMKVPETGTSVFSPNADASAVGTRITTNFPVDLYIGGLFRSGVHNTIVQDRLRGFSAGNTNPQTGVSLRTDTTGAEYNTGFPSAYAFDNTSFLKGSDPGAVSEIWWNFRRAPGFFDVVCYTGTGVDNRVINHNLAVAPELFIYKARSAATDWWVVSTTNIANTLVLNSNSFPFSTGTAIGSPTATTFTVGSVGFGNSSNTSAVTYVQYLFATCPGVSKVGSYTGNGSSQTINCGFTSGARFILIKRTNSTGDWYVWDTARGIVAGNDPHLSLNTGAAEVTTNDSVDTNSTGFVVNQVAATNVNVNAATYIFLAIA